VIIAYKESFTIIQSIAWLSKNVNFETTISLKLSEVTVNKALSQQQTAMNYLLIWDLECLTKPLPIAQQDEKT